ncbi:hypothetical protein RD149_23090 [Gordonia westfalica]|uniref:5-methylcytosine-specific restriction enzyme subunit McrC n=1 Tax=Gordonia westfalica TaxID=158898 RepID=A0ABU2GZX6_9ACTN|nr:hypothetical protein [Gordonia westfalica]MDS1116637.1 hypothetical protein [Gordonia westfalica]
MIEITEYSRETVALPPISLEDQERMRQALGGKLAVAWLSDDRVELRATSFVGSIHLTPDLRVRVIPKLAGGNLGVLTMLALTNGCSIHDLPQYLRGLSADSSEDAVQLLCRLVVTNTEALVTRGLIRDYRGHADDLPFLRGRLDTYRQATVYHGKFTALACSFDEFDYDNVENHLLLAGVSVARRVSLDAQIRRRAAAVQERLEQIAPTLPSTRALLATPIVYGRRTEPYRAAHTWCRALIDLSRVNDANESVLRVETFLIDMNRLFEQFVEWLIAQVMLAPEIVVQTQERNSSVISVNGASRRSIAPDIVLHSGMRKCAIDSKYKQYDDKSISNEDIYQLLLYAQCYVGFTHTPTSYLVFPASGAQTPEMTVELAVPSEGDERKVRIRAVGIPLAAIVADLRRGETEHLDTTISALRRVLSSAVPSAAGTKQSPLP